jgi:hypothetical protein
MVATVAGRILRAASSIGWVAESSMEVKSDDGDWAFFDSIAGDRKY